MTTEIIYRERERRTKYHWPDTQLNLWIFIMLCAASTVLGIFAWFITVQTQMTLGIPWLFPFAITTASLTLLFLLTLLILASQRLLIPGLILLGSFILAVLWLTMLIETSIQLYGPGANINANCETRIQRSPYRGATVETLQYLTQVNICNCWRAAFAFEVVGTVLWVYMMVLSWRVHRDDFDD